MKNKQLSFIDESGLLLSDFICRSDAVCALCGASLQSRSSSRINYWLGGRPPRRICKVCFDLYKTCFDKRIVCKVRGVKR